MFFGAGAIKNGHTLSEVQEISNKKNSKIFSSHIWVYKKIKVINTKNIQI